MKLSRISLVFGPSEITLNKAGFSPN